MREAYKAHFRGRKTEAEKTGLLSSAQSSLFCFIVLGKKLKPEAVRFGYLGSEGVQEG